MEIFNFKHLLLQRNTYRGLTSNQVIENTKKFGINARPKFSQKKWSKRLLGIVGEPMMLLLVATAGVYFFIGSKLEAIILTLSLIPIVLIEFLQEKKTDQAVAALDSLLVEECQVYRDGVLQKISVTNLVPGDLVYLVAGDKLPADGYLLRSPGALVDESILTGETVPVVKSLLPNDLDKITEEHKLNQGTLLVQGEGYMLVTTTGLETAYGKLGNLLQKIKQVNTPLENKIEHLVHWLAICAIIIALIIGVVLTLESGLIKGILGALTIAIAIIPEEFPIVFSVFLIMGVWRMSKRQALVREMAMVEILGSATVICSDKTGTLTEGSMFLEKIFYQGAVWDYSEFLQHTKELKPLFIEALLALEQIAIDPIEVETQRVAETMGVSVKQLYQQYTLTKDSSFDTVSKTVRHIWKDPHTNQVIQYNAGAPESILNSCDITLEDREMVERVYATWASQGYRIIGVSSGKGSSEESFEEQNLHFSGLLIMSDPPRKEVAQAVALCQQAGIRLVMITGDNKMTAEHIARKIGLVHEGVILNGDELEKYSTEELQKKVQGCSIFTRVRPEQKYALVEALQKNGEVVAMTGDGVNDAPALKKADIGIAMGKKGTEVARAAAGIILLDDNFATIVNAVKEGRRIYGNLRQAFIFLFSFHLPIIGLSLVPLLLGQDMYFLPVHIIFLELFCDPAAVIGFEKDKARKNIMRVQPRPRNEPLINLKLWWQVALQAMGIFGVSFAFYYYFGIMWGEHALGKTLAFIALLFTQVCLIIFTREWHQVKSNKFLLVILASSIGVLQLILFIPSWRALFHFVSITGSLYALVVVSSVIAMGLLSFLVRKLNFQK